MMFTIHIYLYLHFLLCLDMVWVFTLQIYLSSHFMLCLQCSRCSQYRFIYLDTFCSAYIGLGVHNTDLLIMALSVVIALVWVFTIQMYLSWHFLLGLCWYDVHNTYLFISTLSVMLRLVWVFTLQIDLSWHFLLCLQCSGCSQYRFIYLDTFCYAYIGLGVHNTIYLSWHFMFGLCWSGCSQYRFIYLGPFCYVNIGLGVHNTDLFMLALSVMLVLVWVFTIDLFTLALSVMLALVWVFTIQIYLSWHFLL